VASILGQTRDPDQFVLVVDGPVPPELDEAIGQVQADHPTLLVERLPENLGSGPASNAGLALGVGDFVARLDSDDISLPARLERQLEAIEQRGLDVVGSYVDEFDGDPSHLLGTRVAPLSSRAIARRARINNPVNNPSMVFRRELALEVGGYQDVPFHEDYDLLARLLAAGARAENLPETLVLFNASEGMLGRRAGVGMLHHEWLMQRRLRSYGIVGTAGMVRNLVVRGTFRLLPRRLLGAVYATIFRRSTQAFTRRGPDPERFVSDPHRPAP
jgi:glycosyltransferase involved in cell wall biosynthesis